jgi:hypothetical protein
MDSRMHRRLFLALCAPVALGQAFLPVPQKERTVVLVVDDLGLSLEGIGLVRAALLRFVEEHMRPGDRAAVIRTGGGTGALQRLSGDKDVLRAAIGLLQCHPARVAAGPDDQARHDRFSAGSRGALRFAMDGLRQVPGLKAVVLFSENVELFNHALEPLTHLVDVAGQAAEVLYVIDPRPSAPSLTDGTSPDAVFPESAAALAVLAERTGGALLANTAGVLDRLEQVLRDSQKLSVNATREALTVPSRTGLFGLTDFEDNAQTTRRQELLQVLATPFSPAGIGVRLTALFSDSASRGSYVEALLHIDAKSLSHIRGLNGLDGLGLDIVIQIYDENGRAGQESSQNLYMTLTDSGFRHALSGGLVYSVRVPAPRPGAYQVRAIVGDAISGNIGYASQFVDIPDVARGQLVLSGILLMGEKFDPLAAEAGVQLAVPNESPALRVFKPGQTIAYAYSLFNPSIGDDRKPAVEARIRLFREGRLIFEGQPMLPGMPTGGDLKRYYIAGRISLASGMVPGDYVIHVTVTDKLAGDKPRQATQSIDFRLEP